MKSTRATATRIPTSICQSPARGAGGVLKPAGHVICPEDRHVVDLHSRTLDWFRIEASFLVTETN